MLHLSLSRTKYTQSDTAVPWIKLNEPSLLSYGGYSGILRFGDGSNAVDSKSFVASISLDHGVSISCLLPGTPF